MMRRSTLADRQAIVALKRAGYSHAAVAAQTGWDVELVRKVWRAYRRQGEDGLAGALLGRPPRGPLSTFPWLVRLVALRLKCQRPHAGPDVILADMAVRPSLAGVRLPSAASLSAYFGTFGTRLLTPRRHRQLPRQSSQLASVQAVHECWLLDFDEPIHWPGVGWVNVMNVVDWVSGLKIGSYVHRAGVGGTRRAISWPQIQANLRDAFRRWGLPDRIRTDHDPRLVSKDEWPVPMPFTLWLVGLDIGHELIQRVTQNGGVERCHRTWEGRLLDLPLGSDDALIQDYVNYEVWRMNAVLPSRGRHCRRRPPLLVYPQARIPRRVYRVADEASLFQMARVADYLAAGRWLRRTSSRAQLKFRSTRINVPGRYANQTVVVRFDPVEHHFEVWLAQSETCIKTFRPDWLSRAAITGLA